MKFTCSLDDDDGLKTSLEASVSESYLGPSSAGSQWRSLDEDLVASAFVRAIPQLSAQLEQVHLSAGTTLLSSFSQVLKEECDESSTKEADQNV